VYQFEGLECGLKEIADRPGTDDFGIGSPDELCHAAQCSIGGEQSLHVARGAPVGGSAICCRQLGDRDAVFGISAHVIP
jgi:hypothetical protein